MEHTEDDGDGLQWDYILRFGDYSGWSPPPRKHPAAAMTESEPIPQCQKGSLLSMQLGRRNGWVRKKHGKLQDKVSHSQIPTKMRRKESKEKKSADGPEIREDTPGCIHWPIVNLLGSPTPAVAGPYSRIC